MIGTEGRNRTDTVSPPPDFESGASTSSATPAQHREYINPAIRITTQTVTSYWPCWLPGLKLAVLALLALLTITWVVRFRRFMSRFRQGVLW